MRQVKLRQHDVLSVSSMCLRVSLDPVADPGAAGEVTFEPGSGLGMTSWLPQGRTRRPESFGCYSSASPHSPLPPKLSYRSLGDCGECSSKQEIHLKHIV